MVYDPDPKEREQNSDEIYKRFGFATFEEPKREISTGTELLNFGKINQN